MGGGINRTPESEGLKMTNRELTIKMGTKADEKISLKNLDFFRGVSHDNLKAELFIDSENGKNVVRFSGPGYSRSFEISNEEAELFD